MGGGCVKNTFIMLLSERIPDLALFIIAVSIHWYVLLVLWTRGFVLGTVVILVLKCLGMAPFVRHASPNAHVPWWQEALHVLSARKAGSDLYNSDDLMKRGLSPRVPSPTPTAFSGISNYQTDSYRPIRDQKVPVVPTLDYRQISKTHFDDLSRYLASYLAKGETNSRVHCAPALTPLLFSTS